MASSGILEDRDQKCGVSQDIPDFADSLIPAFAGHCKAVKNNNILIRAITPPGMV